jgi:hypothetical protein
MHTQLANLPCGCRIGVRWNEGEDGRITDAFAYWVPGSYLDPTLNHKTELHDAILKALKIVIGGVL